MAGAQGSIHETDYLKPPMSGPSTPQVHQTGYQQAHRRSMAPSHSAEHVQFADYDPEKFATPTIGYPPRSGSRENLEEKIWMPVPFRWYFWVPLVVVLFLGAIGLEIALYLSNKNQGWASGNTPQQKRVLHYVYTIPPVIIASIVVSMWAWTSMEINRLQPYVDLLHGDAPPQRSLLLDYSRYNNLSILLRALRNKHVIVVLAALMVLLTFSFQPLSSALLDVREIWWQEPDAVFNNLGVLGLNQGVLFTDLTYFLNAAGYAGAAGIFNLPSPPFVNAPYTIAPFEMPLSIATNGTALVNTTAVKTETNCVPAAVSMSKISNGWSNTASRDGCSVTFDVDTSSRDLFGSNGLRCGGQPEEFSPVAFWFFSYDPTARAAVVFCSPKLSFLEVNAAVDIISQNISKITELRPFDSYSSPYASLSANVTGAPLNGRAYNAIEFDLTQADRFVYARENATKLQLPAAIYQAARSSTAGYSNSFDGNAFTNLATKIYGLYLSLLAREIYFLDHTEPITVQTKTFKSRVFLSPLAVHLLAAALLLLAAMAILLHVLHREERRGLQLKHEPGTIASAVAFGAQTGVGEVLAGRQAESDIKDALRNKKFRIDPDTMKIVMEGEHGYEAAKSPRRRSFINHLLLGSPGQDSARTPRLPPGSGDSQFSPNYQPLNPSTSPSAYRTVHTPN